MMLVISFIAICIACVLLMLELSRFGTYPWWNTGEAKPATSYIHTIHENDVNLLSDTSILRA